MKGEWHLGIYRLMVMTSAILSQAEISGCASSHSELFWCCEGSVLWKAITAQCNPRRPAMQLPLQLECFSSLWLPLAWISIWTSRQMQKKIFIHPASPSGGWPDRNWDRYAKLRKYDSSFSMIWQMINHLIMIFDIIVRYKHVYTEFKVSLIGVMEHQTQIDNQFDWQLLSSKKSCHSK